MPPQSRPSLKIRELAYRLIVHETASDAQPEVAAPPTIRVTEKPRRRITALAGTSVFKSILSRTLAMARGQLPSLASVSEIPQGGLQDFQAIENHDGAAEAGGELVAQILGLLATFIGERLMLDIVLDEGPILCQIIWGLR